MSDGSRWSTSRFESLRTTASSTLSRSEVAIDLTVATARALSSSCICRILRAGIETLRPLRRYEVNEQPHSRICSMPQDAPYRRPEDTRERSAPFASNHARPSQPATTNRGTPALGGRRQPGPIICYARCREVTDRSLGELDRSPPGGATSCFIRSVTSSTSCGAVPGFIAGDQSCWAASNGVAALTWPWGPSRWVTPSVKRGGAPVGLVLVAL